mmetsp:Transcript_7361/g.10880  ORF Transcript_7361/g.10880 Transcript_7361/m.10880 type:complete len:225 (+) Transcript_7361:105-779(+)
MHALIIYLSMLQTFSVHIVTELITVTLTLLVIITTVTIPLGTDLLTLLILVVMHTQGEHNPDPERTEHEYGTLGTVSKDLEHDHGETLVGHEITWNLPHVRSHTPYFLKLMTSTHEESNRHPSGQVTEKERQPELILEIVRGPMGTEPRGHTYCSSNHGRYGNGTSRVSQHVWDEKDTTFGNLTPEIPCDIELDGSLVKSFTNTILIFPLGIGINSKPFGNFDG